MKVSVLKARRLAAKLMADKRSWRKIAREDYGNRVHFALLCKFAQRGGGWFPQDEAILKELGLLCERSPYAIMPKYFSRTPEALEWFLHKRELVKKLSADSRRDTQRK